MACSTMRRSELDPDPLRQFEAWFREAEQREVPVPETMTVATATRAGAPSARQVLLKSFDERGFVFFSSSSSRKGRELAENPRAALLLHWPPLGRQVRIEGSVAPIAPEESDRNFRSRPLGSRLSAAASRQSEVAESREELEQAVETLRAATGHGELPRPEHWGGYRVEPAEYEFWEHREDRLHDRFRYRREAGGWRLDRLFP
ncbi:MAG: pyridoxamine 5'-phosphate oxidase [Actinobacteria bacterium]|nr:pyridoxamine 5'-phosphate oxidase [Actinomycetota bacterium]